MKIARLKHHNTNRGPNGHNTGQLHLCTDTAEKGNGNWLYQLYTTTIVKKLSGWAPTQQKKRKKVILGLPTSLYQESNPVTSSMLGLISFARSTE